MNVGRKIFSQQQILPRKIYLFHSHQLLIHIYKRTTTHIYNNKYKNMKIRTITRIFQKIYEQQLIADVFLNQQQKFFTTIQL